MEVGLTLNWQNLGGRQPDDELYHEELRLAELAEPLGFNSIWTIEHHFTDYAMCPDVLQFLTYMAGRTKTVKLGSMVVVLPWNDPVRVAEQVSVLDIVSGGRAVLGIGRGLGRVEFEGFRVPMDESRERFVEEATILLNALETGVAQLDGKHYRQPARAIRPKPPASFHGRTYAAAVSPESIEIMAQLGVGLMVVPQKPYEMVAQDLVNYRDTFERVNGCAPPAPCAAVYVFCDEDADRARELGPKYIGNYYQSTMSHYELAGSHFTDTKGYEYYSSTSKAINRVGSDAAADAFVNLHVYGTPQECIDKIRWIQDIVGNETLMTVFRFGGIGYEEALRNIQLFARSVKPALQALPVMTHV